MEIAVECIVCGGHAVLSGPAILMPFVAHRALGWEPVQVDSDWNLQTVPTGWALSRVATKVCTTCRSSFMDLRFGDPEMARLYADYRGTEYVTLRESYEPGYRQRNESLRLPESAFAEIEEFLQAYVGETPSVLDWGGDTGENTPFREVAGLLHIFDISGRRPQGRAKSVTVQQAARESYDLVVMSHLLEHLPYPATEVQRVRSMCRPETRVFVEVPLEVVVRSTSTPEELLSAKRHWHEHINFFTPAGLQMLMERSGFVVLEIIEVAAPHAAAGVVIRLIAAPGESRGREGSDTQ